MASREDRCTIGNVLPVVFVIWVISTIWFLYLDLHLARLLGETSAEDRQRGLVQMIISQTLTAMVIICFGRAVFTDPGAVPKRVEWQVDYRQQKISSWSSWSTRGSGMPSTEPESGPEGASAPTTFEVKQTGERRFCKWCDTFKPDRCHHCRVCKSCTLKMDHHCPWIANCVGFRNHKYFFLLVFYALVTCVFTIITMAESQVRSTNVVATFNERFFLVFGMTLSSIMAILLGLFFAFHVMLMMKAITTIEFCEKHHRRAGNSPAKQPDYDRGGYENLKAVLGPNPLLWLLPLGPPDGDGMSFPLKGQENAPQESTALLPSAKSTGSTPRQAGSSLKNHDEKPPEVTGES